MSERVIGNYVVGEIIGRDGRSTVYRGVQRMGEGIERPVSVKLLHGWDARSVEQTDALRREVQTLIALGNSPHIVTVFDFGVDDRSGPWLVMELADRNLNREIADEPGDVRVLRQVAVQMLQALVVLHERDEPIIHRDIKPRNILHCPPDSWVLGDFYLASPTHSERTLSKVTVKYTAPEVIDGSLGEVGPASDLYSLGICLYEFALGRQRFCEQFPAVYGSQTPEGVKGQDEQARWLYWHPSMGLHAAPLRELLDSSMPQDLSDAIESLMRKDPSQRPAGARAALEALSQTGPVILPPPAGPRKTRKPTGRVTPMAKLLVVVLVVLLGGLGAAMALRGAVGQPDIELDQGKYQTDSPKVRITGRIDNMPSDGKAIVSVADGGTAPVVLDSQGRFTAECRVGKLDLSPAMIQVTDSDGKELASALFDVDRRPPQSVTIVVATRPRVRDATVRIQPSAPGSQTLVRGTDSRGVAELTVPYGAFDLSVDHPRYITVRQTMRTEADPEREVTAFLQPLSESGLAERRKKLLEEYESLKARAAAGDPEAIRRMAEIQKQLAQLSDEAPGSDKATQRQRLLDEMASLKARAAAGDPEAIRRLKEITEQLAALDGAPKADDPEARRKALLAERESLAARAAAGDPEAIRRLAEIDRELAQIDADKTSTTAQTPAEALEARRRALLAERESLAARAAAGDPEAIRRLAEINRELAQIDKLRNPPSELAARIEELRKRAAAGDPEAIRQLKELEKRQAILDALARGELTPAEAARLLGEGGALSQLDQAALQRLPLTVLAEFIAQSLPGKALHVQTVVRLNKVRVSGSVLNRTELLRVLTRLAPAGDRVLCELREDPVLLSEQLNADLAAAGLEQVRVMPLLRGPTHRLLVQFRPAGAVGANPAASARAMAQQYVVDPGLIEVQLLPQPAPDDDAATQDPNA